jgi:hypothetical protein
MFWVDTEDTWINAAAIQMIRRRFYQESIASTRVYFIEIQFLGSDDWERVLYTEDPDFLMEQWNSLSRGMKEVNKRHAKQQ